MASVTKIKTRLASESSRLIALLLFLVLVFLTGGGSRDDIQSLVVLRPLAFLFAAYALSVAWPGQVRSLGAPLWIGIALLLVIAVQLVPIPWEIWSALPGRSGYVEALTLAGVAEQWRPISLSPSKTLNSLLSLSVPIAALLLAAIQSPGYHRAIVLAVVGLALASIVMGLLQAMGGESGPLYLYRLTNNGLPVGFLANRNHQAIMLAGLIPMMVYLGARGLLRPGAPSGKSQGAFAMLVLLLVAPTILMTGSRAGLITMVISFAASGFILLLLWKDRPRRTRKEGSAQTPLLLAAAGIAVITGLTTLWFGRGLAIVRLRAGAEVEELRVQLLPTLVEMAKDFFPIGSGFGSFQHVYTLHEPAALLRQEYFNHAHNDWLQVLVEGGAFGAALLVGVLAWLAREALVTYRVHGVAPSMTAFRLAVLWFIAAIGFGSAFDYPLRVPIIMALIAVMAVLLVRTRATAHLPADRPPSEGI